MSIWQSSDNPMPDESLTGSLTMREPLEDTINWWHKLRDASQNKSWIILSRYESGWEALGPYETRSEAEHVAATWEDDAYTILQIQRWHAGDEA